MRYLGLLPPQWDSLTWDVKKTYIEGFEHEGILSVEQGAAPGGIEESEAFAASFGDEGPQRRVAEVGEGGFDLDSMRADLEALRGG